MNICPYSFRDQFTLLHFRSRLNFDFQSKDEIILECVFFCGPSSSVH